MTQVFRLEEIKVELQGAKTVAGFLGDYFEELNPTDLQLRARYSMYGDLSVVLLRLIHDAEESVGKIVEELHQQHIRR